LTESQIYENLKSSFKSYVRISW